MKNKINYLHAGKQKDYYLENEVIAIDCPVCQSNKFKKLHRERGSLGIVQCVSCGLVYTNPRLKSPDQIYTGDAKKYFEEARLIFEGKASHHRDNNYIDDLRLIEKIKPNGKFLDIGSNMGFFLRLAKKFKWELYGVDPSNSLTYLAKKYFSLNIKNCFLEKANFNSDFFDIVSMTDVFEHVVDPMTMLQEVKRILKPDGILFIKVPNGLFSLLKLYLTNILKINSENINIFDSYEHVVHYTQDSLKNVLELNSYKIINFSIGKPIQLPAWHKYVGYYYQYPSPWVLDPVVYTARSVCYYLSLVEYALRMRRIGYLAPNIRVLVKKG